MPRVHLLGAPFRVETLDAPTWQQKFDRTGFNTGNLLIGHAVVRHLVFSSLGVGTVVEDLRALEETTDYIVIPSANFLHESFDLSFYADFLEKVRVPAVMIGVGAQAPSYDARIKIPPGTERFVRIVAERSKSIGVRGYFTAEVLNRLGIKNVRVIGCPSLYWGSQPNLRIPQRQWGAGSMRVAFNGSRNVTGHSTSPADAIRIERSLLEAARAIGSPYVLQNEVPEIAIAAGESIPDQERQIEGILRALGLGWTSAEYLAFARQQTRVFFSVEEWSAFIRGFDFVLGSRFHGNLIALLQGVPAFVIAHDARTRELCELFHMPHLQVSEVPRIDVRALYELADYSAMELQYNALVRNYIEFLDENSVQHKLEWQPFDGGSSSLASRYAGALEDGGDGAAPATPPAENPG